MIKAKDLWNAMEVEKATFGARSVDEQNRYCFDEAASAVGDFLGKAWDSVSSFVQPALNFFAPEIGVPLSLATNLAQDDWMGAGLSALSGMNMIPSEALSGLADASALSDFTGVASDAANIGANELSSLADAANGAVAASGDLSYAPSILESITPDQVGNLSSFNDYDPTGSIDAIGKDKLGSVLDRTAGMTAGANGASGVAGVDRPGSGFSLSEYLYGQPDGMLPQGSNLQGNEFGYSPSDEIQSPYVIDEKGAVDPAYNSPTAPDNTSVYPIAGVSPNTPAAEAAKKAVTEKSWLDKLQAKWDKMGTLEKVGLGLGAVSALGGLMGNKKGASPLTQQQIQSMRGKYDGAPLPSYAYNLQNASGQGFNPRTYGRSGNTGRRFFTGSMVPVAAAHGGEIGHYAKGGVLNAMRRNTPVRGPGGGQDDVIPAMLSDGEHVLDADTVSALGDGSNEAGHKKIEQFKRNLRKHKRSAPDTKIPPRAKSVLAYMGGKI